MSTYQNINQYFRSAGVQYENTFIPSTSTSGQSSAYPPPSSDGCYDNTTGYTSGYDANQLASIAYPSAIDNTLYNSNASSSQGASNLQASQQQLGYINYNESGQPSTSGYTNSYNDVVTNYAASTLYSANETPMGGLKSSSIPSNTKPVYQSKPGSSEWNRRYPTTNWRDRKPTSSKPPQMFYCDTCKISCAGPESFAEHQKGKKHLRMEKEKSDAEKSGKINPAAHVLINCNICDVPCTGRDAYEAHLKGNKHGKVVSLLQKLGKPIPQLEPIPPPAPPEFKPPDTARIKVLGTPKINFHSGGRLHTTQVGGIIPPGGTTEVMAEAVPSIQSTDHQVAEGSSSEKIEHTQQEVAAKVPTKKQPDPVGESYVETVKVAGKLDTFYCKLCDCNFGDDGSKQAHIRGRRHRLAYKKKVDPSLVVDIKPSDAKSRWATERDKKQLKYNLERAAKPFPGPWSSNSNNNYGGNYGGGNYGPGGNGNSPSGPFMLRTANYQYHGYQDPYFDRPRPDGPFVAGGPFMPTPIPPAVPMPLDGPEFPMSSQFNLPPTAAGPTSFANPSFAPVPTSAYSQDDHTMVHHESKLRLTEDESDDIFHLVMIVEKALKMVSDQLVDEDIKKLLDDVIAKQFNVDSDVSFEGDSCDGNNMTEVEKTKAEIQSKRALKGLQRVGILAEDLLITGDDVVDIVVITGDKPTKELLHRLGTNLPKALEELAPTEPFEVTMEPQEAAVTISSGVGTKVTVRISLTSPLMREPISDDDPKDGQQQLLNRQKCLESLASLRRTKWFQARVAHLHPAPVLIRVLRNMTTKLEPWSSLKLWPLQLLVERLVNSAGEPLTPGQALRHFLEAVAGGIVLPGSPGIVDPCEKEQVDAIGYLSKIERESITRSAQQSLRMMAFRQLGKVLSLGTTQTQKRRLEQDQEEEKMETSESKVLRVEQE